MAKKRQYHQEEEEDGEKEVIRGKNRDIFGGVPVGLVLTVIKAFQNLTPEMKHVIHVTTLLLWTFVYQYTKGYLFCNSFRPIKAPKPSSANEAPWPFICFRVVTRGLYPQLVRQNVVKNIETLRKERLCSSDVSNFVIEVVTDVPIRLEEQISNSQIRETVVPVDYQTKTGALFKARALQYCLEDDVNWLQDEDWIVHLDEESMLTQSSVYGIVNFCCENRHSFGHGLITYGNGNVENLFLTMIDSMRCAMDVSVIRFHLEYFHSPLLGWKGSFVVAKVGAERTCSFDHGIAGSVAEDYYLGLSSIHHGFTSGFVQGELREQAACTIMDWVKQQKRWFQGSVIAAYGAPELPWYLQLLAIYQATAWGALPFIFIATDIFGLSLPKNVWISFMFGFFEALRKYHVTVGTLTNFSHRFRHEPWKFLVAITLSLVCGTMMMYLSYVAILWGILGRKNQFHIIRKTNGGFGGEIGSDGGQPFDEQSKSKIS